MSNAPEVNGAGLTLSGLEVGYHKRAWRGSRSVLAGVNLVASAGRVTVLLGPNGSGKSTLLRSVAGLQPTLAGRIDLNGVDLVRMRLRDRAGLVAVVLTDRFDPGLLRGAEVVALGRFPHLGMTGSLREGDWAAVAAAMAAVHAEDLASVPLAEMSDGQRQRVLIARALAQEPALLVLDEPSAFLDAPARIELLAVLRRIAAEREIPVLVSTHDVEAAVRAGQDGWVIDRSCVVAGGLDELVERGVIGEAFDTEAVRFDPVDRTFRLR